MFWKTRLLIFGAFLLGSVGTAWAQQSSASDDSALDNDPCLTDSICRAHFQRGRKLSKEDNYNEALAAYEAAHLRREVPWLLINIGRTLHKLGRPADSLVYYQRYLAAEPSGPPERKQRAEQFQQEAKEEIAKLSALKKPETVAMVPEPAAAAPQKEPLPAVAVRAAVSAPPAPASAPTQPRRPVWLGIGLGAGGAVLLAGASVGIAALVQSSNARSAVYVGAPTQEAIDAQQQAHTLGIATDVLLGVGIVALGVTTVTYLVKSRKKEPPRVALFPDVQLGSRAVAVSLGGAY